MVAKKGSDDDSKTWGFVGSFFPILGFILVILSRKEDSYAMYYAKHGLIIGIAWIIFTFLRSVPLLGWIIYTVGIVLLIILWVMTFIGALSGERKKFIVLTDLAEKIKI